MPEVKRELSAQVEKVLPGGITIEKLNSHMHLHLLLGIFRRVLAITKRYRIPSIRLTREGFANWNAWPGVVPVVKRAVLTPLSTVQTRQMSAAGFRCPEHFRGLAANGRM
jgi:predicted glycoside hydrolase/deacetylase ChbG (UPF0249 family)